MLVIPQIGFVAPIPKSTLELLERFKLDPSIKEGQIAQYAHEYATPLDDILGPKLLPYADQILGKKESFRNPNLDKDIMPNCLIFGTLSGLKAAEHGVE